jgi:hypothetical protein
MTDAEGEAKMLECLERALTAAERIAAAFERIAAVLEEKHAHPYPVDPV